MAAELSYRFLTDEDKATATKYHEVLLEKRAQYDTLVVEAQLKAEQEKRLNTVINLINAIGTVTVNSNAKITTAENAYNKLSDEDKGMIAEHGAKLQEARAAYDAAIAEKMAENAQKVSDAIDAIGEVTINSKTTIETARLKYNALTSEEKKLVYNYVVLESAEDTYSILRASDVIDAIDQIGTVTIDSKDHIQSARTLYNNLTDNEKSLVSNYQTLVNAEKEYTRSRANQVIDSIKAIGTVTINSESKINPARVLYDGLTTDEKNLVTNYDDLSNAEKQYSSIVKQQILAQYTQKFKVTTDAVKGITWYDHVNKPRYIDSRSYIIPYIGVRGDSIWICIRYNYTGDDWIFWEKLTIVADGQRYYKTVSYFDVTRDNDSGVVWEYHDQALYSKQSMDSSEIQMLKAIGNSSQTIIRFEGDNYYYDLYVSATDKQAILDVLALYEALIK